LNGVFHYMLKAITRYFTKLVYEHSLKREALEELIGSILREYSLEPVKITDLLEQYSLSEELHVYIHSRNGVLEYAVVEPELDSDTIYAVSKLYTLNPYCSDLACLENTINAARDRDLKRILSEKPLSILYHYKKLVSGYGPLYPLILDQNIEEIACSAGDEYVSIVHRKYSWFGWMKTNIRIGRRGVDRLVLSLARKMGKHISVAHPVAEGLTDEGLRISLTYGREVSRKGSSFVIRKKPATPWTITKLIDEKTLTSLIASYLWLVMEFRGSILIAGGTSSGKTTLLQALLTLIPPSRRVVSIEDTPEITTSTGYWDPLVERVVSVGEASNIDMYSLLKFSLRRRADYLVVGEVRGVEAKLLVQASRLGHGILATIHAESASSLLERLTSPPIAIPRKLLSNIWCIVIMENDRGVRRVKEVHEITGNAELIRIFHYDGAFMPKTPQEVVEKTKRLKNILEPEVLIEELASRMVFLDKLVARGVFTVEALASELSNYYYTVLEKEVYQA